MYALLHVLQIYCINVNVTLFMSQALVSCHMNHSSHIHIWLILTKLRISSKCLYQEFNSVCKQLQQPGPGCSKLTTSLVNFLLKFPTLISHICQYFLSKKCEKLLHCKSFSHFFNKKYQCIWLQSCNTLNELTS